MRVTLYFAVRTYARNDYTVSLCWTLDMEAEQLYYTFASENTMQLWKLERSVPLPYAIEWCANIQHQKMPRMTSDVVRYLMKRIKQFFQAIRYEHSIELTQVNPLPQMATLRHRWLQLLAQANDCAALLQGRKLLPDEWLHLMQEGRIHQIAATLQVARLMGFVQLHSPFEIVSKKTWLSLLGYSRHYARCRRCGSTAEHHQFHRCAACGRDNCRSCDACLQMGRSRECDLLVIGTEHTVVQKPLKHEASSETWNLTPAQQVATAAALSFMKKGQQQSHYFSGVRQFLLWAVTGAGKTEMIFPLVAATLQNGGRALIATPRKDVVLELTPRLRQAFPSYDVVTLYGGSEQRWQAGSITIATTHQLMRFHGAFSLVIIDEMDAFPYHNDLRLQFAARQVCAPQGVTILLSATPAKPLRIAAQKGKLPHARVPVRYHRYPLPVPQWLKLASVAAMIATQQLPPQLLPALQQSIERGAQLFLFVARIRHVAPLVSLLQRYFADLSIAGTSSQDEERATKVTMFRQRQIRMLVTTTILERGVTIARSDVFILDAGAALFDEASLIQMAGRAGRSHEDPYGHVYFCSESLQGAQREAIRQIVTMNRLAKEGMFLHAESTI